MAKSSSTGHLALPRRRWGCFAALAICVALSGCASGHLPVASISSANESLASGYKLASGDKLRITVFDEPTLTGEYQIGVGGGLAFPLIKAVAADGMTSNTLADAISSRLKQGGYVLAPRVSVEVLAHRPFFILGEVKTPGEYPYTGHLTLTQAIAKAGGYTARADKKTVVLRRDGWKTAKRIVLNGGALEIAPGDTITVREAFF